MFGKRNGCFSATSASDYFENMEENGVGSLPGLHGFTHMAHSAYRPNHTRHRDLLERPLFQMIFIFPAPFRYPAVEGGLPCRSSSFQKD